MATRTTLLISIALLELCLIGFLGLYDASADNGSLPYNSSDSSVLSSANTKDFTNQQLIDYCTNLADTNHISEQNRGRYITFCVTGNQIQKDSPVADFNIAKIIPFSTNFVNNIKNLPFLTGFLALLTVSFFYIMLANIPSLNAGS